MSSRWAWSLVYTVTSRPPKGRETLFKNKKGEKERRKGRGEERGGREWERRGEGKEEERGREGRGGEESRGECPQLLPGIPVHN